MFDSNFTFSDHVSQVMKSTRVHVLLANALVSSRLDYCISLFLSLTDFELRRLQLVQNSLQGCRPFLKIFSHHLSIQKTPLASGRVPGVVRDGPHYIKILGQGRPVCLRELIHPYTSFRNTRCSTPKLKFLHTPTFDRRVHKSTKHFSNSFSHYAPVLWNSFPFQIRNSPSVSSFRKPLKPTFSILVSNLVSLPLGLTHNSEH